MESILEYIMINYTWFLGGAILILLAIIGRYADKTNFGQGTNDQAINLQDKNQKNDTEILVESKKKVNIGPVVEQQDNLVLSNESNNVFIETPKDVSTENDLNVQPDQAINFDDKFKEFDKEFEELVPKKELVDDELLEEIENFSLDKTQKMDLSNIPDLIDVELPKIKKIEPEQQDIWKF